MLNTQAYNRIKQDLSNSQLKKVGCFYVVSVKRGRQLIASSPQVSVEKAVEEFEFKYDLLTF